MAKTTKKRPTRTKIRTKPIKKPTPAQAALLRAQDPLPPVSPTTSSITAIEEVPPVSSSIVRTTNASITMKEYGGLDDAFNHLNRVLFGGELPEAFINYTRKLHMNGHFAPDRYSGRVEEFKKPEIALNPDSFVGRSDEQIVSTLAHEMVHLKQEEFGKPSARGYHNREWAAMMKAIGLMPSNTGGVGGKETGQLMTHYIIPGGAYAGLRRTRRHWMEAESAKHDLRGRGGEEEEGRQDEVHLSGMRLEHVGQTEFQGHLRRVQPMAVSCRIGGVACRCIVRSSCRSLVRSTTHRVIGNQRRSAMNNQEAIVHFEDKDLTASEWLKLVCDRSPLAEVLVRATGDQRYAASAIRDEDDRSDEDCQHCGRPFGDEVEIHQGKDRGKSGVRQMTDTTRELSVGDDGQALRLMGAEIMFYDDPRAMRDAMGELVARGFEVRPFDWRDPCGTETRWLLAWVTTPLDVAGFRKFVTDIVSPDGDVLQWGVIDSSDELAEWLAHDECCA